MPAALPTPLPSQFRKAQRKRKRLERTLVVLTDSTRCAQLLSQPLVQNARLIIPAMQRRPVVIRAVLSILPVLPVGIGRCACAAQRRLLLVLPVAQLALVLDPRQPRLHVVEL